MKKFSKLFFVTVFAVLLCCSVALFGCGKGGSKELDALGTPTGLAYADGAISWTAVEGASNGYTVVITQGETEVRKDVNVTGTTYGLQTLEGGAYTAKVSANAVEGKNKASAEAKLDFTAVALPLEVPTGMAYDKATQTVTFDAMPNASGYIISATVKGGSTVTVAEKEISEPSIDLTALGIEDLNMSELEIDDLTKHTFKIVAKGDGVKYANSGVAAFDVTIETVKLGQPENINYNTTDDKVEWSAVRGADGYEMEITKAGVNTPWTNEVNEVINEFNAHDLPSGDFNISVFAYAPEGSIFYTDGDEKTGTFTIGSLGELEAPANLKVESGAIVWDENDARGYEVEIYETADGTTKGNKVESSNYATPYFNGCSLEVARLGLNGGDGVIGKNYIAAIKATSNRHTQSETNPVEKNFYIETVKEFVPAEISKFVGAAPNGEHAAVELAPDGKSAIVRPDNTPDGWGRVCSPDITVDWDRKPVVYLDMAKVEVGGYHMQIRYNGQNIDCLRDTKRVESTVVDILKMSGQKYTGISAVALRLGVDNSNPMASNNARAHYKSVTVMYVTDYDAGIAGLDKLATPKDAAIDSYGVLSFQGVRFARNYAVKAYKLANATDETGTEVSDKATSLTSTTMDLKEFEYGSYRITIVAQNAQDNATESEALEFKFTIEEHAAYTGKDLSTGEGGKFEPGENGLEGIFNSDTGFVTATGMQSANNSENPEWTKDYGTIRIKDGIDINFACNPLILVDLESISGDDPTYISRISWTDGSQFAPFGDTHTKASTEKQTLVIRAGYHENGSQLGVGKKSGYKFGIGPANKTTMVFSGIRIIYIYEGGSLVRPETPAKLAKPGAVELHDRTIAVAGAVKGNIDYAPTYKITVKEKGASDNVVSLTKQELPRIELATLNLESGKTYTVSFVAEGDTYQDSTKPYFSDSDAREVDIKYTEILKVDDFSNVVTSGANKMWNQFGGGGTMTVENVGKALKVSNTNDWGLVTMPVFTGTFNSLDDILADSALEFHFGEVTGDPTFTQRYSKNVEGTGEGVITDGRGDTDIATGGVVVETNPKTKITFTTINGENGFWVGVGFGGKNGSAARSYQITKIVLSNYAIVE